MTTDDGKTSSQVLAKRSPRFGDVRDSAPRDWRSGSASMAGS